MESFLPILYLLYEDPGLGFDSTATPALWILPTPNGEGNRPLRKHGASGGNNTDPFKVYVPLNTLLIWGEVNLTFPGQLL